MEEGHGAHMGHHEPRDENPRREMEVNVAQFMAQGTSFQQKVWAALRTIRAGRYEPTRTSPSKSATHPRPEPWPTPAERTRTHQKSPAIA